MVLAALIENQYLHCGFFFSGSTRSDRISSFRNKSNRRDMVLAVLIVSGSIRPYVLFLLGLIQSGGKPLNVMFASLFSSSKVKAIPVKALTVSVDIRYIQCSLLLISLSKCTYVKFDILLSSVF